MKTYREDICLKCLEWKHLLLAIIEEHLFRLYCCLPTSDASWPVGCDRRSALTSSVAALASLSVGSPFDFSSHLHNGQALIATWEFEFLKPL